MACQKFCHQTRESAQEHLDNLRSRADEHPARAQRLQVYYHRQCFAWHVGHVLTQAQKRERRKQAA